MSTELVYGLDFDAYRARPGLSITTLKEMARSPLHYRHRLTNPKDSEPFALGRAAHCAVLEPHRFDADFAVWDRQTSGGNSAPRNGKHWDAFQNANPGRTIITVDQYANAIGMRDAVRGHPDAMKYLRAGDPEVSIFWDVMGRQCRGRIDWWHESDEFGLVLVGLKSSQDCRQLQFGRQAKRLGYDLQWAYYYDGAKFVTGRIPDRVVEIVVESKPPHAVGVYIVSDDDLQRGMEGYMQLLEQLAECERTDRWHGPQQSEEVLVLPNWDDSEQIEGIEYVSDDE